METPEERRDGITPASRCRNLSGLHIVYEGTFEKQQKGNTLVGEAFVLRRVAAPTPPPREKSPQLRSICISKNMAQSR